MASHVMAQGAWWAVALREQVPVEKTLAVVCEGREIVLFRDAHGAVHALEDRCPHRRVLLSDGVVLPGGLQCPYHGWTFDGASGQCTDIPNLRRDEAIPAKYKAQAFPVDELNGFIHVWLGAGEPTGVLPSAGYLSKQREQFGHAVVAISRQHYLDIVLDGPQHLLAFPGVQITDFFMGDVRRDHGHLVLDRGAVWRGRGPGPAFVRDHPLVLRTRVPLAAGAITVELLTAQELPLVTVQIAASSHRRGTTAVCWRGYCHAGASVQEPWRVRLRRAICPYSRVPFTVHTHIDGAAIAALPVAPSLERRRGGMDTISTGEMHAANPACQARRHA